MVIPVRHRDDTPYWHALMRELLTSLPVAAAYLDGPDLIIDVANDAWCRLTGDRVIAGLPLRQALPASGTDGPVNCAGYGLPPSPTRAMSRAGPAGPTRSSPI